MDNSPIVILFEKEIKMFWLNKLKPENVVLFVTVAALYTVKKQKDYRHCVIKLYTLLVLRMLFIEWLKKFDDSILI